MPETAINEHRHPGLWKDEVRPAKNRLKPPPGFLHSAAKPSTVCYCENPFPAYDHN
jgi:hypothetical protein